MWVFYRSISLLIMFKFSFTSLNKLSIFVIAVLTSLSAIPSFAPFLGLFLLPVSCLVMGHVFLFLSLSANF